MDAKKIGGIVLVVAGLGLAYSGYQISNSVGGQLSQAFQGSPSDSVMFRYVAGAICVAVGAFLIK